MKLTNLSLAIMVALGVAACGGSDNTDNTPADPPAQNPAPKADENKPQEPEAKNDDKLVDPTGTHVVDGRDLSKESTVGGLQYIRRDSSDYDRVYNPDKMASSTPLLGVSLDVQNPKLTNIVLARRDLEREENKAVRAQFAGGIEKEPLTLEGKEPATPSLQIENFKNVDILAGAFKQVGSAKFADAATNRLDPVTHNIDTHIQNNTDKDGEFTRERVSHVYTLRYEYKQPHVDYPHGPDGLLNDSPTAAELSAYPPGKPRLPTAAELKADASWQTNNNHNKSWHAVNNGLGDGPKSGGYIVNNEAKYGSLDGATGSGDVVNNPGDHSASASNWKNKPSDPENAVNWTTTNYPNSYWGNPKGAYPRYPAQTLEYPNYKTEQPRYPNEPYLERTRRNATHTKSSQYTHEHTYLDQEEFTAIRVGKAVRPLQNPVPNTWQWTLVQTWNYQESYDTGNKDANNNPIYAWRQASTPATSYNGASDCGTDNCNATAAGQTRKWELVSADWTNPQNQGGGQLGWFRGPHYYGWQEYALTLRFNDERIWKPGTPGYKPEYEKKYGANLIWWSTQDSAFENWATLEGWNPRARRVDNNDSKTGGEGSEDLVWANGTNNGKNARDRDLEIQPTGDITNGLIRIGGGRITLGEELKWDAEAGVWKDHHNTTSRIFGHYHLAFADQDDRQVKPMTMNSYLGARSFVAEVQGRLQNPHQQTDKQGTTQRFYADLESKPKYYSIGAEPMTLHKVQYGRVTTNLDLAAGEGPLGEGFLRAPFAKKNTNDSVDNYFFRGVDATTIEEMAALPKEGSATYNGHALMYGLNNDFHGITGDVHRNTKKDLPNAFDGGGRAKENASLGFGNFVEANVDFATRKVKGDVYNAWLVDTTKPNVVHDKLVAFEGDIIGNTVIGTADRTYAPGNDKADFRAAFFGSKAEEMGGSFNSVAHEDKYGSAYETGDWGGVFGAKKTGGSSNNTFQGDDSNSVYGNTNVAPANNYNE